MIESCIESVLIEAFNLKIFPFVPLLIVHYWGDAMDVAATQRCAHGWDINSSVQQALRQWRVHDRIKAICYLSISGALDACIRAALARMAASQIRRVAINTCILMREHISRSRYSYCTILYRWARSSTTMTMVVAVADRRRGGARWPEAGGSWRGTWWRPCSAPVSGVSGSLTSLLLLFSAPERRRKFSVMLSVMAVPPIPRSMSAT